MNNSVAFGGLTAVLPEGWFDLTGVLPKGLPTTLGRPDGAGALQFTVVKHQAGALSNFGAADLKEFLLEFAEAWQLGSPLRLREGRGLHTYVTGDFEREDSQIRVWCLSNSRDVALITYLTLGPADPQVDDELRDASSIIDSTDFD